MVQGPRRILRADGEGGDGLPRIRAWAGPGHDRSDRAIRPPAAQRPASERTGPSRARADRVGCSCSGRDDHRGFAWYPALEGCGPITGDPVGRSRCRGHAVRDSIALPAPHDRLTGPDLRAGRLRSCHALWELWKLRDDRPAPRPPHLGARVRGDRLEMPDELASPVGAGRATAVSEHRHATAASCAPRLKRPGSRR